MSILKTIEHVNFILGNDILKRKKILGWWKEINYFYFNFRTYFGLFDLSQNGPFCSITCCYIKGSFYNRDSGFY